MRDCLRVSSSYMDGNITMNYEKQTQHDRGIYTKVRRSWSIIMKTKLFCFARIKRRRTITQSL